LPGGCFSFVSAFKTTRAVAEVARNLFDRRGRMVYIAGRYNLKKDFDARQPVLVSAVP